MDLNDEGAYLALAYRFALGDSPFRDEFAVFQSASVLTTPFVFVYQTLANGTEGLVLFIRILFLSLVGFTAWLYFRTLKNYVNPASAMCVALIFLFIVPLNIPSLSYNTWSTNLFVIGLFILMNKGHASKAALAGVLHALSAFAYPAFLLGVVVTFLVLVKEKNYRQIGWFVGGGVVVALALLPLIHISEDSAAFTGRFSFYSSFGPGRLVELFSQSWRLLPKKGIGLVVLGIMLLRFAHQRWQFLGVALMTFVGLYMLLPQQVDFISSIQLSRNLAVLLVLLILTGARLHRPLFWKLMLPCLGAGLGAAWISSHGITKLGLVSTPLAGLTILLVCSELSKRSQMLSKLSPLALGGTLFMCFLFLWPVYLGGGQKDDHRVASGPYKGLWTNENVANIVGELEETFGKVNRKGARVLVYPHLPGAYLFTPMLPAAASIWGANCPKDTKVCEEILERSLKRYQDQERVVIVSSFSYWDGWFPDFNRAIRRKYPLIFKTSRFQTHLAAAEK